MKQIDFFDHTLENKINRLEKWIVRLNREMLFLKRVYELNETIKKQKTVNVNKEQLELFG